MEKAAFFYAIYIASTPEKVWNALIDPEMTRDYWGRHRNASDWQENSRWEHQDYDDPATVDIAGKVLESRPPRRLVLTWALPAEETNEAKVSRVSFDIEPFLGAVRLRLTHTELEPESEMHFGIREGWPAVLSSMKTMLETGDAMEMSKRRWNRPPE